MHLSTLLLLFLLLMLPLAINAAKRPPSKSHLAFTPDAKDYIVQLHNKYRKMVAPGAANMSELTWNDAAELYALEHASCGSNYFRRRNPKRLPFGELLSVSASSANVFSSYIKAAFESSIEAWWEERNYYLYNKDRCVYGKRCESYIQLVWASTTSVGCAYALNCRKRRKLKYNFYVVCYYYPAANIRKGRPYVRVPVSSVRTRGGTANKENCVFPFYYDNKLYTNCTKSLENDSPWCRTESGGWGYCIPDSYTCSDRMTTCYIYRLFHYGGLCPAKDNALELDCRRSCSYCACETTCQNGGSTTYDCGCTCQNSWAGDECDFCPIASCNNGGSFDAANCKCNCVDDYEGVTCDSKDNPEKWRLRPRTYWYCKWSWIKRNGLCTVPQYRAALRKNCPALCNFSMEPLVELRKY